MGLPEDTNESGSHHGFSLLELWRLLGSMRFAIWILVLLAILTLTVLLLSELVPTTDRMKIAGKVYNSFADLVNSIFKTGLSADSVAGIFGFIDPFRSLWFRILLAVLGTSLIACIIQRTPRLVKLVLTPNFRTDPSQLSNMEGYSRRNVRDGRLVVSEYFRSNRIQPRENKIDDREVFYGVRGSISRLGPLLSHTGLLFLIIGGLVISLTGGKSQGIVAGGEGQILTNPDWGFSFQVDSFKIEYYPILLNQWIETPEQFRGKVTSLSGDSAQVTFEAHQDHEISRTYHVDSLRNDFLVMDGNRVIPFQGSIKSYITYASVILDDQVALQKKIEVNHPLRYGGYRFYQTDFELLRQSVMGVDTVVLDVTVNGFGDTTLVLAINGNPVDLNWEDYKVNAGDFYPDFRLDKSRQAFSASTELRNPAVQVMLMKDGVELERTWAFPEKMGMTGHMKTPFSCSLVDISGLHTTPGGYVTRLSVYRENGRWLVWIGFLFSTIGFMLVYMISYRQAWGIIIPLPDGKHEVHLVSKSRHN